MSTHGDDLIRKDDASASFGHISEQMLGANLY
jgi:hypothetical protein